ncbi:MAG TPA: rhodanese-like domain-containing protein [Chloroflexota bacterium]|nr:rhodanese-like domain-containing protein [Chloroflexota bacterium]
MAPNESSTVLAAPQWLQDHLYDPGLRLVEVDVSPKSYDEWHIENATLWNIYRDLKDADYRLIDKPGIQQLLERSGITPDTTVVFYGYGPAIGFWLTKLYGHTDARILDCDKDAWRRDGRPCSTAAPAPAATQYPLPDEDGRIRAQRLKVEAAIGSAGCTLLDVRSMPEFAGERFWPSGGQEPGGRAGHIPSAINVSMNGLYDESGAFRPPAELRERFAAVGLSASTELITYCTIGARACTAWFVLTYLLDRPRVRVYDGSWAEWGRIPSTPVERWPSRSLPAG